MSTEDDIYDLTFSDVKINKKLEKDIFKVESPPDFSQNIHPLDTSNPEDAKSVKP
jgi:hypothetical protein